ncbi:MAG TPA: hypothetical protein VHA75_15080, partial [Rugosimonospora sp.]|nr:hypothetical protein [Rugosimonospora sp.]
LAVNVPAPGETDTRARAWRVSATSAGNVAATAVIDEPNLSQDHIRVDRITANQYAGAPAGWEATVEWVDNTGDHGTAHLGNGQFIDAASGRWFVSAKATAPIAAARILRTDGSSLTVSMDYRFKVDDGAVPLVGQQRTNTADVSVTYPADADGDGVDDAYTDTAGQPLPTRSFAAQVSRTVQYTEPLGQLNPGFAGISVDGGGQLFPGTNATFTMRATTANVWPGTSIQPQLVFVAPVGWHVIPGSAAISANGTGWAASPASPSFAYATKTIAGTDREVVVATWPSAVSLSSTVNEQWPTLSVKATPTNTAPVGVNTIAQVWAGDQSGAWSDGTPGFFRQNAHQFNGDTIAVDATDVDGDGNVAEDYSANVNANGLIVAATDSVSAIKELCVPDPSAADGCQWVSDPAHPGEVLVNASALTYRIRIVNSGNTDLTGVVAYDVLPHVGDTGLLPGGAPRGSQFALTLGGIDASTGVIVAGSSSTNPARPEVNPTASGTVDDWGPVATGDRALRLTVDGSLAPAAERTVVFHAAVASGVTPGQQACNSAAVDSDATLPAEPAPVCVTLKALPNPPPTAAISSPTDGASYDNGTAVTADFTCADTDLASCLAVDEHGDPVAQGAAIDTTTPGSHSLTVVAIDSIGQMDTASVSYTVKVKPNVPPTASITTPANGAVYFQGQKVPAAYTCADPDGTVASCVGTVAVGSDVDTATLGSKTFTVTATDDQGATGAATTTYTVVATKGVCRGTALGLTAVALPISLGVANGPTSPCATDLNQVAKVNVIVITPGIPLLGIAPNQVTVGALKGASQSGPGSAAAQAEVASVKIQLLGQTVEATGLTSSAASVLSSCAAPAAASGLSSILTLTINGKPVANLHQSITVPLVVGALALNEHAVVGGGVSQTALHLDVLGRVDLALGQSVAGATS